METTGTATVGLRLNGTAALVTGAASGLGETTARELVKRGARVALLDLNAIGVRSLAGHLGGQTMPVAADVTDEQQVRSALHSARALGPPRLVVCCHGVLRAARTVTPRGPAPLSDFEAVVRVNLIGTYNVMRLAAAEMITNEPDEGGERGVMVLTASIAGYEGQVGQTAYAASKAAIIGLTLPAARDLAAFGIRVCSIAPGVFDTPMLAGLDEASRQALAAAIPFPAQLGDPRDFAALVCHIAENSALNGETIRLDGALRLPPR